MVTYIEQGDIFAVEGVKNYAHGCNCAGAMGAGIAVQFKKKFPAMYAEYRRRCMAGEFLPGDVYAYHYGDGFVFNLGTEKHWRLGATLEFIGAALEHMMQVAEELNVLAISLPKIGAGYGGLRWEDVKQIINDTAERHPRVHLFVVENYSPERQ